MDMIKPYSRRSFWLIFLFMVLFAGALAATIFYGKIHLDQEMSRMGAPDMMANQFIAHLAPRLETYSVYLFSLIGGLSFFTTLILWLVLRRTAKKTIGKAGAAAPKKPATKSQKDKQRKIENRRLFSHLLVVLQREGRLLDFFQEDLDMYEDDQIGAAVRDIHSNCKKIITKNLALEPIVNGSEGEEMTVESGFDPDAIKLTGRVTGEPPFTGIIRHKGWKAKKMDLPDLSAVKDPTLISPAEVEIE